jgi:hypothetical protein
MILGQTLLSFQLNFELSRVSSPIRRVNKQIFLPIFGLILGFGCVISGGSFKLVYVLRIIF